jgi:hypothetical protein
MKLKEYIDSLTEFAKSHPETLELEVIYAIDDEGNGYNRVHYTPTKGVLQENEFYTESGEDFEDSGFEESDINAVCIN